MTLPDYINHRTPGRDPIIKDDPSWVFIVLFCRSPDTSFTRIDRSSHNVEIPSNNNVSSSSHEEFDAFLQTGEKVHLVWPAGIVCLVRAVKVEQYKQPFILARVLESLQAHPIIQSSLTRSHRPQPDLPYPTFSDQMPPLLHPDIPYRHGPDNTPAALPAAKTASLCSPCHPVTSPLYPPQP